MTTSKDKAVNYTAEMVEAIRAAAPLNLEKAKELGEKLGRSYRSIIAKAKSEGIEYVSAPAPAKKPTAETKAEIVSDIEAYTGLSFTGLVKAPASDLRALRTWVGANAPEPEPVVNAGEGEDEDDFEMSDPDVADALKAYEEANAA